MVPLLSFRCLFSFIVSFLSILLSFHPSFPSVVILWLFIGSIEVFLYPAGLSTGGFDQATGFAWVVSNPNLFLWKVLAGPLPSHSIKLPLPSFLSPLQNPKTPPVVSLVEKADGDVAIICASGSGVGAVFWPGVLGPGTGAGEGKAGSAIDSCLAL
jgi:hypothetical protein